METRIPVEYRAGTLTVNGEEVTSSSVKQYQIILLAISQQVGHIPSQAKGFLIMGPDGMRFEPETEAGQQAA